MVHLGSPQYSLYYQVETVIQSIVVDSIEVLILELQMFLPFHLSCEGTRRV